ncbi:PLP-dependent aminotransferase family protein [Myxococcota bacterium]|nr:PLP-dependent aminotransferase family protein [Myxococcota bacterium]MBU1383071.1 PLP-dependent aminotransferase family protein [Myxococcota bacterium]MBU1498244.1 PLP-dependent aminotransferase family protein [Myxococcota bacterium]
MISDLEQIYSDAANSMKRSVIRELLKLTSQPDIISFAGGLPSPDSFPKDEIAQVMAEVMAREADFVLQYGTTEGDSILRNRLVNHQYVTVEKMDITEKNLIIVTASQQALDLIGKIFINRGDKIIVGLPSYLGGLSAFRTYGADMVGIELDDHGMRSDKLEETLKVMQANGEKPKFIYVIPDFQNPTGITMPDYRRREILDIAIKYDVLIIEDSPYRELRFEGEHQQMIYSMDNTGHVVTLGTFSKILCPGFRIGWVIAHEKIIDKIVMAKQATDLCTSPFTQRIAARFLERESMNVHINSIVEMYREKRDIMLSAFEKYMPEGVTWVKPEGGLFLFLTLPEHIDTQKMFMRAIDKKVAYVIGSAFHSNGLGNNTMRINFSYTAKNLIEEGVKRLADAIREELSEN